MRLITVPREAMSAIILIAHTLRPVLHTRPDVTNRNIWTLLLLLLVLPLPLQAHTLHAPETVQAAIDGSFSYDLTFTVGPGTALLGGIGWWGVQNVAGEMHGDCFCIPEFCLFEQGEIIVFPVEGVLIDPTELGLVDNWVSLCDRSSFPLLTTILPPTESVQDDQAPTGRRLNLANEPNPFAGSTMFTYELANAGPVTLRVYNTEGRLVATPVDAFQSRGRHAMVWWARDTEGAPVVRGVYFARLDADGMVEIRTLVIDE
ncbi:T9SS type A sorting domain-containing protein [Candidatus Eisenbacteria bacterium]|uniref:T9SS type A sorting domain-containing protein n=1 Tax=Eiseniibacteriota bacterium TaxID=2212470 RepID=A0ABV6YJX7_UNCEI